MSLYGVFSTIFAVIYSTNANIINNIKIGDLKVSGWNKNEAEETFSQIIEDIQNDEIILKHNEDEKKFTFRQMELETDYMDKIYEACKIGRSGNIIHNNYEILDVLIHGRNIDLTINFNEEILQSIFSNLDTEWEGTFIDNSYYIEGDKLKIVKGKEGIILDEQKLREELIKCVNSKIQGEEIHKIDIPTITKVPEIIDIEKIQKEIYKEAKDASYDAKERKLSVHSNGIDLGVTLEDAKKLLAENKEEYEIPLKITKPSVTTDMLGEEAFPNVLGKFSTRFDASNINRATNIELAAKAIDGTVLIPGEKFSFNSIVGPTTASKGYLLAGAYSAGELVENYGGGICQVSSTVYNTALYANLDIVQRFNHSSIVSYVDPGLDATISYGSKDLKISNPRKYAIKIHAKTNNGILEVQIVGIKEDDDVEIELTSKTTEVIPCTTRYIYDSSLSENQQIVKARWSKWCKKYYP